MKLLLDTNIYVAFVKGETAIVDKIRNAEEIILSTVVIGELIFGFRNGNRFEKNMTEFDSFRQHPRIKPLAVTEITADRFARIATVLKDKGRPIPSNDIWIAAHAMESGAELVSFDKHFREIDGLVIADL